jgi:hypothetical protein
MMSRLLEKRAKSASGIVKLYFALRRFGHRKHSSHPRNYSARQLDHPRHGTEHLPITTDIPARRLVAVGRFHTLVVVALGITWIFDGLEVTLAGSLAGALKESIASFSIRHRTCEQRLSRRSRDRCNFSAG